MKVLFSRLAILVLSTISLSTFAVEEMIVIGTPTSPFTVYSTDNWYMNSMIISDLNHNASVAAGRSMYEAIQRQLKACATAKDRIQKEYSDCRYFVSQWNTQAIGRCSDLNNSGWSVGGGRSIKFLIFNVNYTLENPTYDKCINMTGAIHQESQSHCSVVRDNALLSLNSYPVCR